MSWRKAGRGHRPSPWGRSLPFLLVASLLGLWPAAAAAQRAIVVVGPASGRYAAIGAAMRTEAVRTAERLARSGKDSIRLTFEDDACQADKAAEVARAIAARKPDAVVGHPCSGAAIAAAPIYAQAGIVFLTPGARHPALTNTRAGPSVFRLTGRDDRQGEQAAAFAQGVAGGRPIAVLHDRTFHMSTLAADVAGRLNQAGGQAAQFPFVASELDYGALVTQVVAFGGSLGGQSLGAVVFAGYPQEAILILRALRQRGVTAPFLGTDALATDDLGVAVGNTAGAVFVLQPAGAGSVGIAARTEAAIEVVAAASRARGGQPLAEEIAAGSAPTRAFGAVSFDAKGDVRLPSYTVSTWKGGSWTAVSAALPSEP